MHLLERMGANAFNGLDQACKDTSEHFGLKSGEMKRLLEMFDKIGVNPITLPNHSEVPRIRNIRRMISECADQVTLDDPVDEVLEQVAKDVKIKWKFAGTVNAPSEGKDTQDYRDAEGFYVLRRKQPPDRDADGFYQLRPKTDNTE